MYFGPHFLYICPVTNQTKVMNQIFEQAILSVKSAYPSVYTKEDVIRLIQDIRAGVEAVEEERKIAASVEAPYEEFMETLSDIKVAVRNHVKEMDFAGYVELEMGYDNQIHVNVDYRSITEEIEEAFEESVATLVEAPKK